MRQSLSTGPRPASVQGVVVAGAYGHWRLREWVLGGVTQHLATEATRCVLLSR